ncbi:hypothetical protein MN608_05227 [Microdochium nivale]|nr:hypothetical protein MN608_05227 [Microdochium nivale]
MTANCQKEWTNSAFQYEILSEWAHFTRLIRYSSARSLGEAAAMARRKEHSGIVGRREEEKLEEIEAAAAAAEMEMRMEEEEVVDSGPLDRNWIGKDSSMLAGVSEAE